MSGRVISGYRADGTPIVGYRKTTKRRRPPRPMVDRITELNERCARREKSAWPVRVGFLLPKELTAFVSDGPHGTGIVVWKGFVHISGGSADQCFRKAYEFLSVVARDEVKVLVSVISLEHPGEHYCRHLTYCADPAMVVSAGTIEPRTYQ